MCSRRQLVDLGGQLRLKALGVCLPRWAYLQKRKEFVLLFLHLWPHKHLFLCVCRWSCTFWLRHIFLQCLLVPAKWLIEWVNSSRNDLCHVSMAQTSENTVRFCRTVALSSCSLLARPYQWSGSNSFILGGVWNQSLLLIFFVLPAVGGSLTQ